MSGRPHNTLESGYNKFVIKNKGRCWGWSGCAPNPGYGQFRCKMKLLRAHHASWLLYRGEIPQGMFVLHTCDNRICSNPDHLFLGTNDDNIRDMLAKERHPTIGAKGEKNPNAKLTIEKVREIRKLITDGLSYPKIARLFSVHEQTIGRINRRELWEGVS